MSYRSYMLYTVLKCSMKADGPFISCSGAFNHLHQQIKLHSSYGIEDFQYSLLLSTFKTSMLIKIMSYDHS